MRWHIERWSAPALFAGLVLAGAGLAQAPGQKERPPKGTSQGAYVTVEDIVARILAFDKNKDGKVTREELPQRMHHLIALGDTNKDGALDRDEIRSLATRLAAAPGDVTIGGPLRVGTGPGPGGPGGIGAAILVGPDAALGAVDDLKLPAGKRDQALAAVKAHQENVRKLMDQARAELLAKMREILSEEEFKDFRAALDRPRGQTFFSVGPRVTSRGSGQQRLDPPPK